MVEEGAPTLSAAASADDTLAAIRVAGRRFEHAELVENLSLDLGNQVPIEPGLTTVPLPFALLRCHNAKCNA